MTRVSSKPLSPDAEAKLFAEFSQVIARTNKKSAGPFMGALLTKTEQIMLAKRIGIIMLLHKNVPAHQIAKRLHVSSQTVSRIRVVYRKGRYDPITQYFDMNKQEWSRYLRALEIVLYGVFPSRTGFGRYKYLNKALPSHNYKV